MFASTVAIAILTHLAPDGPVGAPFQSQRGTCVPGWEAVSGIESTWDKGIEVLRVWDPDGNGPEEPVVVVGGTFVFDEWAVEPAGLGILDLQTNVVTEFPGIAGTVYAIAVMSDHSLLVGGRFPAIDGVPGSARLARWDGSDWHAVGTPLTGDVSAIVVDENDNIYVGGALYAAGGDPISSIAYWDGSAWNSMGAGATQPSSSGNRWVRSLALLENGDIVAGGIFREMDGVPNTRYIARWDGTSWHSMLSTNNQADDYVQGLHVDRDHNLLAVGYFASIDGVTLNGIGKWDGSSWSALGSGMGSGGMAYAVTTTFSDEIVVGSDNAYIWDGSSWSVLDSGVDHDVWAVTGLPDGDLMFGGQFETAGAVTSIGLARWNACYVGSCSADFDGNGSLNFFDVSGFLNAHAANDPSADIAAPFGVWNFFDVSAFIALYAAGC